MIDNINGNIMHLSMGEEGMGVWGIKLVPKKIIKIKKSGRMKNIIVTNFLKTSSHFEGLF